MRESLMTAVLSFCRVQLCCPVRRLLYEGWPLLPDACLECGQNLLLLNIDPWQMGVATDAGSALSYLTSFTTHSPQPVSIRKSRTMCPSLFPFFRTSDSKCYFNFSQYTFKNTLWTNLWVPTAHMIWSYRRDGTCLSGGCQRQGDTGSPLTC